jgi:CheY-like chemotaxis protein
MPLRILVAEDEVVLLMVMAETLRSRGDDPTAT